MGPAWPLSVVACFALEDGARGFLGRLDACEDDGEARQSGSRSCISIMALKFGHECHIIRQEGRDCGWMLSLKSLYKRILLAE